MAMYYEIANLLSAPLEDVLLRVYPATFFKWLYTVNLRELAETNADKVPPPERPRPWAEDKGPKKAYLISLLLAILRDPALGRRFFETLPPETRDAIKAVTWDGSVNLAALETTLGRPIAEANPDARLNYQEPFVLLPPHGFLIVRQRPEERWSYYAATAKPKKENYCLLLPDSVRKVFKGFVPPPSDYELLPLESRPAAAGFTYSCTEQVIADLRLVAEYIAQGHLKYTKAERVALPSLKALHEMMGGTEFFANTDDADLALLRTRLLVGGMAFAGEKDREKLLARAESAEPVRGLLEKVMANGSFLHEELLDHLAISRNRWCQYSPAAVNQLALFFGKLPVEKWIAWENIRRYHTLREELPSLFAPDTYGLQAHVKTRQDAWSAYVDVREQNQFELIGEPLLRGFAFLLAAFGVAEVAYRVPKHPTYCRPKKDYLTPYDGLGFVRLTPLGEFVFRRRDTYEVTAGPPAKSAIILDETRLLATCRNADKLTVLALGQFMEPLTPDRYRMTPKSLLGRCNSRADIEERIRLFRRAVSATPPAIWERFFERILARIAPLNLEPDYVVLKVSGDEEIRNVLASDPVLRELVLKVQGLRIAVRHSDLKKLAKRLEQFGYLSPVPRLTWPL